MGKIENLISTKVEIDHSFGIYIKIDKYREELTEKLKNEGAKKHSDITIDYYGVKRNFTTEEFIKKLGFEIRVKDGT